MSSKERLEYVLGRCLSERKATLATAESCSGGLLAHRITNVPGSSAYFLGGLITYGNDAKVEFLGIPAHILAVHGAVSDVVAQDMAQGVRQRFGADWGIGVTGIAGPGGATAQKPVGLVYIAVAGPDVRAVTENRFSGSREEIKDQTAERALALLWEHLK